MEVPFQCKGLNKGIYMGYQESAGSPVVAKVEPARARGRDEAQEMVAAKNGHLENFDY